MLGRSVIAAKNGSAISTIGGFLRKGSWDYKNEEYIDAIYDYYLIFETLFANGKFKSIAVKKEFIGSTSFAPLLKKPLVSQLRIG